MADCAKDFRLRPPLFSPYGEASRNPAPVSRMMAAFAGDFRQGVDINLGVGYVNEDTIPRRLIEGALHAVLQDGRKYKAPLNYGGPSGSSNLVNSLRSFYLRHRIGGISAALLEQKQIVIGASGATSILEALADVLRPGIVITSDPLYYIYGNFLERKGFRVIAVPEDDQGMRVDLLEEKIYGGSLPQDNISFFYIVTVNNPTSTILSNSRRRLLVDFVCRLSRKLGREIPLIADKAYEELVHDSSAERPQSLLSWDDLGVVYEVGTISKILAPAMRIGYLIGPPGVLIDAVVQKTSDTGFSAPLINQEIASYLLDHSIAEQIAHVNRGYQEKASAIRRSLDQELGGRLLHCSGGQAGFYFYLELRDIDTTANSRFFKFLARETGEAAVDGPANNKKPRVIYIPGEYCVHPCGDLLSAGRRQLRLSYGFEETVRIVEALTYIRQACDYACRGAP